MAPLRFLRRAFRAIAASPLSPSALVALTIVALVASGAWAYQDLETKKKDAQQEAYRRPPWNRNPPGKASRPKPRSTRRRTAGAPLGEQVLRRWRDASGAIDIDAVLVAIDATGVTLRREDRTETTLPVAALAPIDRHVAVRELRRSERDRPEDHGGPIHDAESSPRRTAAADPEPFVPVPLDSHAPGARRPAAGSWKLPRGGLYSEITAILPGGDEEKDWTIVEEQGCVTKSGKATLVHWLRPDDDESVVDHALPDGERILDYHPVLELLLTVARRPLGSGTDRTPDSLTLWDVSPRLIDAAPVARWTVSLRAGWRRPWARIVDDGLVLSVDRDRDLVCFDAWNGKTRWRVHQDSSADAPPTLDASRTKILLPEDGGVRVLDALRGAEQATVSCPERTAAAALAPDGCRLAIVGAGRIRVHDLVRPAEPPAVIEAPSADAVGGSVVWIDDDIVAASNQAGSGACVLYSVTTRQPLRRYVSTALPESADATTTLVPGAILSLVAPPFQETRSTLGTVVVTPLPDPEAERASISPPPPLPPVVAPGTAVNVYTLCGNHDAEVRGVLMEIVRRNGWVYDRESPLTLAGYLFEQKPTPVSWRTARTQFRPATVRPTIASIRIVTPAAVLWEKSSGAFVFDRFTADEGQSPQEWVDRVLPPGPAFFRSVTIPESIPDPRERYGMGTSALGADGPEPIDEP